MNYSGKRFSLMGDSISTFLGVTDEAGVFYGRTMCRKGGLADRHDTWWMRVIDGLGGVLEKNDSWSGSCVAPAGLFDCASSETRCAALGRPDVILLFLGGNDAGFADVEVRPLTEVFALDEKYGVAPGHDVRMQYLITGRRP